MKASVMHSESDEEEDYEVYELVEDTMLVEGELSQPTTLEEGELPQPNTLEEGDLPQPTTLDEFEMQHPFIPKICNAFNTNYGCLLENCPDTHLKYACPFFLSPRGCNRSSNCRRSHDPKAPRGKDVNPCQNHGCKNYCIGKVCIACFHARKKRRTKRKSKAYRNRNPTRSQRPTHGSKKRRRSHSPTRDVVKKRRRSHSPTGDIVKKRRRSHSPTRDIVKNRRRSHSPTRDIVKNRRRDMRQRHIVKKRRHSYHSHDRRV
jgi:hypothetical protein